MSRFNTGNPLGSGSPLDLDDNAKNFDEAINTEDPNWVDRFGRFRMSVMEQERQFVAGQAQRENEFDAAQGDREERFNTFIAASGYQFAGDYAPGIEITEYNQVIRDENGEFWRVSGQVDLPYVTTGGGIPEGDALVPAGDAVLRQDLANPDKGAAMVARGVLAVDSIADLLALPEGQRKEGLRYLVASYHPPQNYQAEPYSGGGEFYWDSDSEDVSDNGIVFSPDAGSGRFIRKLSDGVIYSDFYGADKTGVEDASARMFAAKAAAERLGLPVIVNNGTYNMGANGFVFDKPISFQGQSRTGVIFKFSSSLQGAAVHVAKNLSVNGARIGNFTCNGFPNAGSIGMATGSSITESCVDSTFENMRFFNFYLGLLQTYSWANSFTACRFQSCTKPFDFASQVNVTTYNACSFVSFTVHGTFRNCEGVEFISPNIANFTDSSTGLGFSLLQSSVVMQNPYFENPSAIIGEVGSSNQTLPSSLIVTGGIANPADFVYVTTADRIDINGIRVQSGGGAPVKIRNKNVTPDRSAAYIRLHMFGNSENQIKEVFNFTHEKVSTFPVAYTGNSVTYALERDYFTINQATAGGGIRIFSALVPGRQYTLVAAVRKATSFDLIARVDSQQSLGVAGIPVDDEEFRLQHFYFVAQGTTLRWLFTGELQVKRIALYEGVVETSQDLPRVSRWSGSSAPTSGTWVRGDQIDLSNPAPGGFSGLICTSSGTPGAWKGFGSIEA